MVLSGSALAQKADKNAPPPMPTEHPDWAKVKEQGESSLKQGLFDPTSAIITYTSGFQWGFAKPIIGRKRWGWVACGNINAKNRMGGYVGATNFTIYADPAGGGVYAMMSDPDFGTCMNGQKAELQPELRNAVAVESTANGRLGVAEELTKLADLKAKGIITEEEFQAQKAKLLAR